MKTFIFQGDSITDCGRNRSDINNLGNGYPSLVASYLGLKYPKKIQFINKGVSGDKITNLHVRLKEDVINLKPDFMSVLIGINDVWWEIEKRNGIDNKKYFRMYSEMLEEIKAVLPDIKIFILEPFVLEGKATKASYNIFKRETELRAKSAKELAEKFNLPFIPLQKKFNEALSLAPADYWLADGVHPTPAGHQLIAQELLAVIENEII